ncbi:ATP-dependent DNA helicase PcrA [Persicimonas caeni]|uniref:DNA 3'-5' helicase n=1 Tax=Persicimonas caeni TaxID=2292766 RepID=A0A4Y6PRY3_PERCE|nr:UvrD-helicase domain-containing protein [Persicimonas caeni]QDG51104.1 ATP-dependent DNA helicase PcrA [Persicimonas caeni]QED32325.1 AAA family ATPase [Persicimonas caeni]
MNLLEHLNPPQKQAVEHKDGPLLILAGAGSGKTRVITYRIGWLILEAGVYPEQILAVTFTNKAAGEMRERVDDILSAHGAGDDAEAVTISTFHSFCARLLRRHADRLGLDWNFNIYDGDDQLKLVKQVMELEGRPKDRSESRRLRGYINRMKNQGYTPELAHENAFNAVDEEDATFYETYQEKLREANCADFGDLILGVLEIFRDDPRLADSYSRHWRYLMVDEFQDTNPAQYELLKHLTRCHDNLAVVGDDDQAIYRWRGATVANILGFEKDYEDAQVIKLEQNYRSTSVILEAANDVIKHNPTRRDKKLWTEREGGDKISLFTGGDDREEATFVARRIHEMAKAGADWGDFAVFYRTNAQSRQFEEQLQNWGVPYQVVGGISFYERSEIKDVLAYLKVALNPDNEVDFLRIINTPSRRIGKVTIEKLQRAARVPGIGTLYRAVRYAAGHLEPSAVGDAPIEPEPFDVADEEALADVDSLRGRTNSGVEDLCELLFSLRDQIAADEGLAHVSEFLLDQINYHSYLESDDAERVDDRWRNVRELLGAMEEFEQDFEAREFGPTEDADAPEGTDMVAESRLAKLLGAFLDRSALVHSTDQMDEKGAVTLMTVHGAKGLEFDTVFLAGMEDEIFPSVRDQFDAEEIHEERRLAYVAITRARHKLYICNARRRRIYGKTRNTDPSRFLLDIDPERIEIDPQSTSKRIRYSSRRTSNRGGYDAFRQATEQAYFGSGVDQDAWEFDQSPPMYKNQVSKAVKKTLAEAEDGDFDTSFSQVNPWDDEFAQEDAWSSEPDAPPAGASPGKDGLTGCTISHSRFGIGEVVNVSGSGDKAVLTINFPGKGEKTIIRKFVKVLG